MSHKPVISDDPMYRLLRDGHVAEFNRRRAAGEEAPLAGCDFSGLDLRGLEAADLDLGDAAFHETDLRGVDLRRARLEGASIHGARIAGTYFPPALSPAEIELSLEHGTRLRYGV
jgi:uncharacterized protein YjbI with pentapeptide repeats